ncbi:MAG: GreA/GreB family elongation factor [Bacilli bacterium]
MRLTYEEVQRKNERIDELKKRLERLREERTTFSGGAGNDEPYYALISQLEGAINNEILQINQELLTAEIIEPEMINENLVSDGDVVTILMTYPDGSALEQEVTVKSDVYNYVPNVVSINSPIGQAIFGKEIGSSCECQIPMGKVKIEVLGKTKKLDTDEQLKR